MKKLMSIVMSVSLASTLFLGCNINSSKLVTKDQYKSQKELKENLITAEIDISKVKNEVLLRNINDVTKKNGVYCYTLNKDTNRKYLFFFNGVEGFYSDVKFSLENKEVTVSYKYTEKSGCKEKSLFLIDDIGKVQNFEALGVNKNGNRDTFEIICLSNVE